MRCLQDTARVVLALWLVLAPVKAWAGSLTLLGAGGAGVAGSSYVGPGDVASGATVFGSCARVYNAAAASTATSLCDLVDSASPTVVICTLRGSSTGFVDLAGTYCTGSLTPAAKCAAATGGVCNVSKVYDQTGNLNHFTNTTAASQPRLTFSAVGGLPGMTGTNGASTTIITATNIAATQPYTIIGVGNRTNNTGGIAGIISQGPAGTVVLGGGASLNQATFTNGTSSASGTASDAAFHDLIGVTTVGGSTLNVDGSSAGTGSALGNLSSTLMRAGRSASTANSYQGTWMEFGVWPSSVTAATMSTNIHSLANGYNF